MKKEDQDCIDMLTSKTKPSCEVKLDGGQSFEEEIKKHAAQLRQRNSLMSILKRSGIPVEILDPNSFKE